MSSQTTITTLEAVEQRILWLAMQIVHHANKVRPNPEGSKVGGHQASSASMVSLMTALYFDFLEPGDRVSVKPHASPVFHAIQYLMGRLDRSYLTELRTYGGLQAYPSRTKDPDPVDFSTGSVGLGCVAPNYAALAQQYVNDHFGHNDSNRHIALLGDAELDEGSVWESIAEPSLEGMNNIMWVVDLNRQSLDRVVPGIRVKQLEDMFTANGWKVLEAKYGYRLTEMFDRPGGDALRTYIDDLPNPEYQALLRISPEDLVARVKSDIGPKAFKKITDDIEPATFARDFAGLGGHDIQLLSKLYREADTIDAPCVVFAYTIKGWGLPIAGDPMNHSALLDQEQMDQLAEDLGIGEDLWARFDPDSEEGRLCEGTAARLTIDRRKGSASGPTSDPGGGYPNSVSTQRAFGLALTRIARADEEVGRRMVTMSPDVATSTNLAGFLNQYNAYSVAPREQTFADEDRLVRWNYTSNGQHVELGISEMNLFLSLGAFGATAEMDGELLFPVGTLYDPFVCRGLDAFIYALYSNAKFVVAGTPSGVTLSWEGGAHQSSITPSIGLELPGVTFWEPCFAQEVEWILLDAFDRIARREDSAYLRLSTRDVAQSEFPKDRSGIKEAVLSGGYRIHDYSGRDDWKPGANVVTLLASGVMVLDAIEAARSLEDDGIYVDVVNVTSADRLFKRYQERADLAADGYDDPKPMFTDLVPEAARRGPLVSVIDGHPAALAWMGSALGMPQFPLGVTNFGQSGARSDLYRHFRIDSEAIAQACISALWSANPVSRPRI